MHKSREVLMVGTCGIDCYHGLDTELKINGAKIFKANTKEDAEALMGAHNFHLIMVNLEPDGEGGIAGSSILPSIANHQNQQDAVCLSISTQSSVSLLQSHPEYLEKLKIISGWLDLPTQPQKAASLMVDIMHAPGKLSIKHRS